MYTKKSFLGVAIASKVVTALGNVQTVKILLITHQLLEILIS